MLFDIRSAMSSVHPRRARLFVGRAILFFLLCGTARALGDDYLRDLHAAAMSQGYAAWGHWGPTADKYNSWVQHTNRLIPVYTFGATLDAYRGEKSVYRDAGRLQELYGRLPEATLNPHAGYFDQTDIYRLQQDLVARGKKHLIVFVFDGMDWQTTLAAATYNAGEVPYREGRGAGLRFLDYRGTATDYGYFVTSPHNHGTQTDVDAQSVENVGGRIPGGYDPQRAGPNPWTPGNDSQYITSSSDGLRHAFTDSASSATSLFSGIKTYNGAINVGPDGEPVAPLARELQNEGWAIGVVTSVPISHATPACAYANNVHRDDYQDLSRDLLGRPSIANAEPLAGVDVLLGGGWGEDVEADRKQGANFVSGNKYLSDEDRAAVDVENDGRYRVITRTSGADGGTALLEAAAEAAEHGHRLFGYFGVVRGHLPFRTADGGYDPLPGARRLDEEYSEAELRENPTLAEMTEAALLVLEQSDNAFWLMVESGDLDWANHDNNIDASVGAVLSGDEAFAVVIDWVEQRKAWNETAVIVTADHGHYLVLDDPSALVPQ